MTGEDAVGAETFAPGDEILRDARAVVAPVEEHAVDAVGLEPGGSDGRGLDDDLDADPEGHHVGAEGRLHVLGRERRQVAIREHVARTVPVVHAHQACAVLVADAADEGRAPALPRSNLHEDAAAEGARETRVPAPFILGEPAFDALHLTSPGGIAVM